jgi:hypothetical protein
VKSGPKVLFYGLVARLMIGWDGQFFEMAPRAFFIALWPDSLESSWWEASQPLGPQGRRKGRWDHFSKWPQGPFLRPCGPILWNPIGGKHPSQSGHKAVENALGATFHIGLFYGLVARFSRILLVGRFGRKCPKQSPIGPQG